MTENEKKKVVDYEHLEKYTQYVNSLIVEQSGGGGIILPEETAEVGDQLYVAEVDNDGKPTKWSYTEPDALDIAMRKDISELTYSEISLIVRSGKATQKFQLGDQITTVYTDTSGDAYTMPFDVVAFRTVELENGSSVPGMIIQSHYATVETIQFDAPETNNPSDTNVKNYGWNRWKYSGVRQWLNSANAKGSWWTSQQAYDVAPSQLSSINGFMKGFPTEFIAMLKPTKHETALNYIYPSGSEDTYVYDTTYDTFFLPSMREEHCQYSSQPTYWDSSDREGTDWGYWIQRKGTTAQDFRTSNTNAIRYHLNSKTTTASVWLRSAYRFHSCSGISVNSNTGYLSNNSAYGSLACAPACVIC